MVTKSVFYLAFVFGLAYSCPAQEEPQAKPIELEVLKPIAATASIGSPLISTRNSWVRP